MTAKTNIHDDDDNNIANDFFVNNFKLNIKKIKQSIDNLSEKKL